MHGQEAPDAAAEHRLDDVDEDAVVTVATLATEGEAEVIRAKLEACGIESSIDDDSSGGTVPTDGRSGVTVLVRASDAGAATAALVPEPPA